MRIGLERILEALDDQAGIAPIGVDLVEQQFHRRQHYAQVAVRLQFLEQPERATAQLARGEHFRGDWAQCAIGGEKGHLHHHAPGALSIDDEHIVTILEGWQQIAQSQAAIGRLHQQGVYMSGAVVGHDQFKILNQGSADHLLGSSEPLRDEFVTAGLTSFAQGIVTGQSRLAVQVQQQHAQA
ncbi:hypothetical protein D3C80_1301060 [compost metagenome]